MNHTGALLASLLGRDTLPWPLRSIVSTTARVHAIHIRLCEVEPCIRWTARMQFEGEIAHRRRPTVLAVPFSSSHVESITPLFARTVGQARRGRRFCLVAERATWHGVELELTLRSLKAEFVSVVEHLPRIDALWRDPIPQPQLALEGNHLGPFGLIRAVRPGLVNSDSGGVELCLTSLKAHGAEWLTARVFVHLVGDEWQRLGIEHRTHVMSVLRAAYEELEAFTELPLAGSLMIALDSSALTASSVRGTALCLPLAWFLENGAPTRRWRHLIAAQLADLWWGTVCRLLDSRGAAVTMGIAGAVAMCLSARRGDHEAREHRRATMLRRLERTTAMPWERSTRLAIASWRLTLALDDWLTQAADAQEDMRTITHRWAGTVTRSDWITREFARQGVVVPPRLL
jgi:hypothetical protein